MIQVDFKKNIQKSFVLTSQKGFTLSEVLITIAIIGIVAALTIPALLTSIEDNQFQTAYKKAFTDATIALMQANVDEKLITSSAWSDANNAVNFNTFMSYFNVIKTCNNNASNCWSSSGEKYLTQYPSSLLSINFIDNSGRAWSNSCSSGCGNELFVDTNGFKSPNQFGKDRFVFLIQATTYPGIANKITLKSDYIAPDANNCPSGNCYYFSWITNTK